MLASGWSVFRGLDPFGLAAVIVATIAAAIVAGGMIYAACWMYKIYLIHRERVKMIERGMDPGPFVEDAEEYRMVQEAREGEGGPARERAPRPDRRRPLRRRPERRFDPSRRGRAGSRYTGAGVAGRIAEWPPIMMGGRLFGQSDRKWKGT